MKLKLFCLSVGFLFVQSFDLFAQQGLSEAKLKKLDSLNQVVLSPVTHDTARTFSYLTISQMLTISNPDTALVICRKSLQIIAAYPKSKSNAVIQKSFDITKAGLYNNLGFVYMRRGIVDTAFTYYEQAYEIGKRVNHSPTLAKSLNNLGAIAYARGDLDQAVIYWQESVEAQKQLGNKQGMASALNNIGAVYNDRGNLDKALEYWTLSVSLLKEVGDDEGVALGLSNLGLIYVSRGEYQKALELFEESAQIDYQLGNADGVAGTLNFMALVYQSLGQVGQSISYFEQSSDFYEASGNTKGVSEVFNNLSLIYFDLGETEKALTLISKSIALKSAINDVYGIAVILNNLGMIYYNRGFNSKAMAYLEQSENTYNLDNAKELKATIWLNKGLIFFEYGDFERALNFFERSKNEFGEMGNKLGQADALNNIGLVMKYKKQPDQAMIYYQRSFELYNEMNDLMGTSKSLYNQSNLLVEAGEYRRALASNTKSLITMKKMQYKDGISRVYNSFATIYYRLGDLDSALKYADSTLIIANDLGFAENVRRASLTIFKIHYENKQAEAALFYLSRVNQLRTADLEQNYFSLAEEEKTFYFATMDEDFAHYYDFSCTYRNQFPALTDTCYNLVLRNKGLALKSTTIMRQSILESKDSSLIELYNDWLYIKRQISKDYANGKETRQQEEIAGKLEEELVKRSGLFSDFDKITKLDWIQVRDKLKPGEAAIEFADFGIYRRDTLHSIRYVALIVKPDSKHPELIELCNEEDLKATLGIYQGNNLSFINALYGKKNKGDKRLYELVWKPLEPFLQETKQIFLSPSGLLHKVSFAALSKGDDTFLCDSYNIRVQSTTGALITGHQFEMDDTSQFTLVGGVQYNTAQTANNIWEYLPGTLEETDNISKILTQKKYALNYFKGIDADERKFKSEASSANFIHIATHGFFFSDPDEIVVEKADVQTDLVFRGTTNYASWSFVKNKNPLMRSGIVLAGANDVWNRDPMQEGEDGILTAQEVSNLDMRNTELVVLSACETGLGDIRGSEGVYGLQRAFKMAGVQFIIMSLWQVPDKETAEFMTIFYKKLVRTKDLQKSFAETQVAMRQKYDPYYWAAFILME